MSGLTSNTHVHLGIRNQDTIVLAFRGTDFFANWSSALDLQRIRGGLSNLYTDLCYSLTALIWGDSIDPRVDEEENPGVLVHEGVLLAFNSLLQPENKLRKCIDDLTEAIKRNGKVPKFEICGHSLGGALATLCALWCRSRFPQAPVTCVTLGSPRVGNDNFKSQFERSGITCYRLVNGGDPIPTIPNSTTEQFPLRLAPSNPNWPISRRKYRHAGRPIWLHVGQEISLGQAAEPGQPGVTLGDRPDIAHQEQEDETNGMQGPKPGYFWSAVSRGVGVVRAIADVAVGGVRGMWNLPDHIPLKYVGAVGNVIKAARQQDATLYNTVGP
ncbi:hypothetical protein VTK26DRAFT_942 [Humicola hyalothermophila]